MSAASPFADDAPAPLASDVAAVALWWCSLAAPAARRTRFETWLAPIEHARMQRFGTVALQQRYLVGRATLRWLLGNELGIAPADVVIVRGTRGRPRLHGLPPIDFNVSHTGERMLVGVGRGVRLGVDVERRDRTINTHGIARKFLTEGERAALADAADAARQQVLRLWTCKEALSKATGDALSAPFGRIAIALEPAPRVIAGPPPYTPPAWSLHALDAGAEHFATLALWHGYDAADRAAR